MNNTKWIKFQLWWLIKLNILKHVQRRCIYRLALEDESIFDGVCLVLGRLHYHNYKKFLWMFEVVEEYWEFTKQKPEDAEVWWWPIGETEPRINALKEAIKLTYKK